MSGIPPSFFHQLFPYFKSLSKYSVRNLNVCFCQIVPSPKLPAIWLMCKMLKCCLYGHRKVPRKADRPLGF